MGDARLRDDLLERFDTASHTVQLWSLDYFAVTAKGDLKVRAKLGPYLHSTESPLRTSPRLRSLLEWPTAFSCGERP